MVKSGGSLIESTPGVDATIARAFTGNTWHIFCLPTSNDFPASPLFNTAFVDEYSEPSGAWHHLVTADNINDHTGYSVRFPSGSPTLAFEGTINTGDQNFSELSYTPAAPEFDPGWHLLGNPFPSAVTLEGYLYTMTNFTGYAYVWNGSNYYAGPLELIGHGKLPGNIIPAMQGFFAQATAPGARFIIPQTARVHSNVFYKHAETLHNVLMLSTNGNGYEDKAILAFNPASTAGFDGDYDAYKLFGIAEAPQLYYIITDNILTVNSLPDMETSPDVSLGFKAGAETTYTLTATGIESFDATTPLLLEDLKTNTPLDLRENPVYTFSAAPGDTEHRFNLHFKSTTGIGETVNSVVGIYSSRHMVYISNPKSLQGSINVYDITGHLLSSTKLTGILLDKIDIVNYTGNLVVKVITVKGVAIGKVFVNKGKI